MPDPKKLPPPPSSNETAATATFKLPPPPSDDGGKKKYSYFFRSAFSKLACFTVPTGECRIEFAIGAFYFRINSFHIGFVKAASKTKEPRNS
jgi:hypothetical protein